jgi:RNA polymerase sigma factor (sigma-70 family)
MASEPNLDDLRAFDRVAWAEAFRLLWPRCLASARRVLGDRPAAADAAQAALAVLPRRLASTPSWPALYGLAWEVSRRQAHKILRVDTALKRSGSVPLDWVAEEDLGEFSADAATRMELESLLARCLSEQERRIVEAIHLDGRTSAEVAAEAGVSASAIRGRLYEAMTKLRRCAGRAAMRPLESAAGRAAMLLVVGLGLVFLLVGGFGP